MKSTTVNALRLLILGAAAGVSVAAGIVAADRMEARIETRLAASLAAAGHDWVAVSADGLTATLGGTAPDEAARFRALAAAGDEVSPTNLRDAIDVQVAEPVAPPDYRLEILRSGPSVTLHGLVPGGPAGREALVAEVRDLPSVTDVSDLLSAAAQEAPEGWAGALKLALAVAARLDDARLTLRPGEVALSGLAASGAQARVLTESFRDFAARSGVALSIDLRQPRPVISPFVTRFRIDDAGARFETCAAETEAGRDAILDAARRAGAGAVSEEACTIGLGAPDPRWSMAAVTAIEAASRLETATVTISDLSVVLVAGGGTDPDLLSQVSVDLEARLPEMFTLRVLAPQQAGPDADGGEVPAPADEIAFTATRSPEGLILLRGPVGDAEDRALVAAYADALFGEEMHRSLAPMAGLPSGWPIRVMAGLEAFAAIETGSLRVTPAAVELRGSTGDRQAASAVSKRLLETLGADAFFTVAVQYEEALDPAAGLPTAQECVARVNAILERDRIDFAPGSTQLDTTALGVVDRIAAALRDCPDVAIEIGGHTDSQGRDEMNLRLSQARADAVYDALIGRRLRMSKLSAKGYGEERPVADNATGTGRELNRRIEFTLLEPAPGEAADPSGAADGSAAENATADDGAAPADGTPAQACVAAVNGILAEDKITFAAESVALDDSANGIVEQIAEVLRSCPRVDMEIGGHTDSQGRAEMNTQLSQARADAVFNALIEAGLPAERLSSRGYGEDQPVADNGTAAGREANRRIEFTLSGPGETSEEAGDGAE